jgi:hypothetical protein
MHLRNSMTWRIPLIRKTTMRNKRVWLN